jgi:type IV secretory pathway TrbD component
MGFVLWLLGTALAVTYAIKDEQVDKERERRRRYEHDCAKRLEEEIADGRAD